MPSTYCSNVGVSGWLWREKEVVVEVGEGVCLMGVPRGRGGGECKEGDKECKEERWGSLEKAFVSSVRKESEEEKALAYSVGLDRSVDELLDVYPEYPNLTAQEKEEEIRAGRKGQYIPLNSLNRHKMEHKKYI